jgi:hypothetical protein
MNDSIKMVIFYFIVFFIKTMKYCKVFSAAGGFKNISLPEQL